MIKRAKLTDLKIGLLVKEYESSSLVYKITGIFDDAIHFRSDRSEIGYFCTKSQFLNGQVQLFFDDGQLSLL